MRIYNPLVRDYISIERVESKTRHSGHRMSIDNRRNKNVHEHVLEHLSQARKIDFLFWFATHVRSCPSSFKCNYLAKTRQAQAFVFDFQEDDDEH